MVFGEEKLYSKRIFEDIAEILRDARRQNLDERTISEIEDRLMILFQNDNPRFNPVKFVAASHV